MRTEEQEAALLEIQQALLPQCLPLLDEFAAMLAGTPDDDVDREVNNIGFILKTTLDQIAPRLSESMRWGLPFAFVEMLRGRMRRQTPAKA